ncbi:hypothetical protein J1N35_004994 [Gossypium stocksii]|uniref:Uncharacterized protein n=1 Tax=Gossypium stocksii TaxID=47602 RepID=A0A9D4AI74_9ROSI|nr:hypothetical protein J1N35_004994 [Gossypium stocksii]
MESESKVHQLEDQIKAQEEHHLENLERFKKENSESLEQYKVKVVVGIMNYLPKLRSKYILHAQVAMGPFDIRRVDINYLHQYINEI